MAEPFFFKTPSGYELVILTMTKAEYVSYLAGNAADGVAQSATADESRVFT